jgi:hypothetical protein
MAPVAGFAHFFLFSKEERDNSPCSKKRDLVEEMATGTPIDARENGQSRSMPGARLI